MEISFVRRQVLAAMDRARKGSQQRRERAADAAKAYETFLAGTATPVARMLTAALKAEGYPFTVATPGGELRITSDHGRDDYIELALDTSTDPSEVVARTSRGRGSRRLTEERPVKPGALPTSITDEELLEFLLKALDPWLER